MRHAPLARALALALALAISSHAAPAAFEAIAGGQY